MSDYKLDTDTVVKDADGNAMVVGERYEMYVPVAKLSEEKIGIVFKDNKDYSFEYTGILHAEGASNIGTPDISYDPAIIGVLEAAGSEQIRSKIGGSVPLCPTFAAQWLRPVTDE